MVSIGRERGGHRRMIPTMSGLARPEFLATTTGWPSSSGGRRAGPGCALATRWERRRGPWAGRHSGRRPFDWRAELVDTDEDGDAIRLAAPGACRGVAERPGIGDGTTVVIYDDTQGLFAARVWWTLQAYVSRMSGSSTAGTRPGGRGPADRSAAVDDGLGRRSLPSRRAARTECTSRPGRRGLLGSRSDAARRPRTGGVPRVRGQHPAAGAHPGRRQRPGRDDARAGSASGCATGRARGRCTRRTSAAAGGWSLTTGRASPRRSWPSS